MGPPNHITLKQQHEPPLSFFLTLPLKFNTSTQVLNYFILSIFHLPHVLPSHINSWQQPPLHTSGSHTLSTQMAAISLYLMFPRDNDNNSIINNLCILSTANMYVMQTTLTLCSIFLLSISNQFICVLQHHHQCTEHNMIVYFILFSFWIQYI
jgi:hypothetical protein